MLNSFQHLIPSHICDTHRYLSSNLMLQRRFEVLKARRCNDIYLRKSIESPNFQSAEIIISRFSGLNYEELKTKQKV